MSGRKRDEEGASPVPQRPLPVDSPPEDERSLSTPYRYVDEMPAAIDREPFAVDPDVVDRALLGHRKTQNALACLAGEYGFAILSPGAGDPDFDVAWSSSDATTVAEVKTLTPNNEARQLRLGLGQVLDYQDALSAGGRIVRAVLAVDREPSAGRWQRICARHGVTIAWPGCLERACEGKSRGL